VSPLYFFLKNLATFYSRQFSAVSPLISSSQKLTTDLFLLIALSLFIPFTRVSPLSTDLVSPLFFVNLATKIFFPSGVTPLEGVTRGGPLPSSPLVTPLHIDMPFAPYGRARAELFVLPRASLAGESLIGESLISGVRPSVCLCVCPHKTGKITAEHRYRCNLMEICTQLCIAMNP